MNCCVNMLIFQRRRRALKAETMFLPLVPTCPGLGHHWISGQTLHFRLRGRRNTSILMGRRRNSDRALIPVHCRTDVPVPQTVSRNLVHISSRCRSMLTQSRSMLPNVIRALEKAIPHRLMMSAHTRTLRSSTNSSAKTSPCRKVSVFVAGSCV